MRTTLTLLLLVLGLGVVLWFTQQQPPPAKSAAIPALDGRSLRQCTRMRWQFAGQPAYEFNRREDGLFQMVEPIVDRASRGFLEQIVNAWDAEGLVASEMKDDQQGRQETGLETPEVTFLAEWPDGHRVECDIGAPGPLGDDRFVRRDGKIWRGSRAPFESMRVNIDNLRDLQVFLLQESTCTALRVEHRTRTGKREVLELARKDKGRWRMTHPYDGRAEPVSAVRFVTAVLSLRADTFLSGLMRDPEGEPEVVIKAVGARGEESLSLWLSSGAAYGQMPGRSCWFQCDPRTYESVFHNAIDALRAKTLVGITNLAEELAEIIVDPGQGRGDRIRLLRDSVTAEWQLIEPVAYPAHPSPVNELVQAINNMRALEFADGMTADSPGLGLTGSERVSLSIRAFEDKAAQTTWLGSTVERGDVSLVYACRDDEQATVVLTPQEVLEHYLRPWTAYCALDVVRIAAQVGRLELERRGGEQRAFGAEDGHWVMLGKSGNRDDVGEFINDELRDLRARRGVDLRGEAFGDCDWTVRFCRDNGDRLKSLRVWDRGGDLPLVVQPEIEGDLGFELGAHVSKQLRALWQ
ncbi:MAG: DUF4340 domain-containing protein [Planctomycetes bacterium]|nr:DUF4340 domain-containing protein [Planctomycetota bacterium]